MLSFLGENRAPLVAVSLLVGFLLLLSVQIRSPEAAGTRAATGVVYVVVAPLVRASAGVVDAVGDLWSGYVGLRHLRDENHRLEQEVGALRMERQRLSEAAWETERLRKLLGLREALTLPSRSAEVMRVELTGPFRVALLDRGRDDGVSPDDAVITPDGVVGRVTDITRRTCRVQLIIDTSSGAAAMIGRSRQQGMVVGRRSEGVQMQYLSVLADVRAGDVVDTSGLDGIYPRGLRIGRVVRRLGGDRLQQSVAVETAVDFHRLEEVLILTGQTDNPDRAPEARQ
ncbi:MAG: rod shape-determining protein MreC [Acidobacteriota bacterium]